MNVAAWIRLKKYHYDLFLKNASLLQVVRIVWKKILMRRGLFQSLEIGVTYECQLDCLHCGVEGQRRNEEELSTQEIKNVIDSFHVVGGYFIVFAGAEPLLRTDIYELISYASQKGMVSAVSTNGLMITEEAIFMLKKSRISFLNISLDSADKVTHDRNRGRSGCYDQSLSAFQLCAQHSLPAIVSTYATKENLANGDLSAMIDLARSIGAAGVRILVVVPAGKLAGCGSLYFTEEENAYLRSLLDPEFVYVEGVCNTFTECNSLLKKLFYISPYGDVQPCSFVPLRLGNIRKKPLSAILSNMKKHLFFNSYEAHDCIMRNLDIQHDYFKNNTQKEIQDI